MKITIEKLKKQDYSIFTEMFLDYFIEDMHVKYDKEKLREDLVKKTILTQYENKIIFIDVIKQTNLIGFIIYQIDNEKSDWKERDGCGFIREFCVKKDVRGKGFGSLLLQYAENNFKNLGVKNIYLTSDENEKVKNFYIKNGYYTNHDRNKGNNNEIFEKMLI